MIGIGILDNRPKEMATVIIRNDEQPVIKYGPISNFSHERSLQKAFLFLGTTAQGLYRQRTYPFKMSTKAVARKVSAIANSEIEASLPLSSVGVGSVTRVGQEVGSEIEGITVISKNIGQAPSATPLNVKKAIYSEAVEQVFSEGALLGFDGIMAYVTEGHAWAAHTLGGRTLDFQHLSLAGLNEFEKEALIQQLSISVIRGSGRQETQLWLLGDGTEQKFTDGLSRLFSVKPPFPSLFGEHYAKTERHATILLGHRAARTGLKGVGGKEVENTKSIKHLDSLFIPSCILTLSFLLVASGLYLRNHKTEVEIDFYKQKQADAFYSVMPEQANMVDPVFQLKARLDNSATRTRSKAVETIYRSLKAIRDNTDATITKLNLNKNNLHVHGTVSSFDQIEKIQQDGKEVLQASGTDTGVAFEVRISGGPDEH